MWRAGDARLSTETETMSAGVLQIKRYGEFQTAYCPYSDEGVNCGTWCPLLLEGIEDEGYTLTMACAPQKVVYRREDK